MGHCQSLVDRLCLNRLAGQLVLGFALLGSACADDTTSLDGGSSSSGNAAGSDDETADGAADTQGTAPSDDEGQPDDGDDALIDAVCGDGLVSVGEQCDGDNLGGKTCASFGWEGTEGGMRCGSDCTLDLTSCLFCGNGAIDEGEECDGQQTDGALCSAVPGFEEQPVGCTDDCRLDFSGCNALCGNGQVDAGEDCEFFGFNFCDDVFGPGWSGELTCANCQFDLFNCSECGDGVAGGWEDCDGSPISPDGFEWTCQALEGPTSVGEIACTNACNIDGSQCTVCGDGIINGTELCDPFDVGDATCESQGFAGGSLSCAGNCQEFNTSACNSCGNDVLDFGEVCDTDQLDSMTCELLGFADGELGCDVDCELDLSGCGSCGDGIVVPGEACDGEDIGEATCAGVFVGAQGGTLSCDGGCNFDPSGCLFFEPGAVVVSEVLYTAAATPETPDGQWIELYNPNLVDPWQLQGCEIQSNLPFEAFVIDEPLEIPPGGFVVLGTGDATALFFDADAQLGPTYSLSNDGDVIRVVCGGVVLDEVNFDDVAPWPEVDDGQAIALSSAQLDATANDDASNWCGATTMLGAQTFGTPALANDCP